MTDTPFWRVGHRHGSDRASRISCRSLDRTVRSLLLFRKPVRSRHAGSGRSPWCRAAPFAGSPPSTASFASPVAIARAISLWNRSPRLTCLPFRDSPRPSLPATGHGDVAGGA